MGEKKISKKDDEPYLTYEELAAKKNLTTSYLRKARAKYGLPHYKFSNLVRFKESEFDRWASERRIVAS